MTKTMRAAGRNSGIFSLVTMGGKDFMFFSSRTRIVAMNEDNFIIFPTVRLAWRFFYRVKRNRPALTIEELS